ncbi:unknown [Coraliomargarita sp. CAG:312]|nr:unknown [Coraliomargarita sp. CAG:312]
MNNSENPPWIAAKKFGGNGFPRNFSSSAKIICPPSRTGIGSMFRNAKFIFSSTAKDKTKEKSESESL